MKYIMILIGGALNRIRGSGFSRYTGRVFTSIMTGIFTAMQQILLHHSIEDALILGLIVSSGILLAVSIGWSKYFMSFTGVNRLMEHEVPPIDWIVNKIFGTTYATTDASTSKLLGWGTVAMCLRGILFYPMFIAIAIYIKNPYGLLIGLGCTLMGIIYGATRYMPYKWIQAQWQVPVAEFLFGAWISFLIQLCIGW